MLKAVNAILLLTLSLGLGSQNSAAADALVNDGLQKDNIASTARAILHEIAGDDLSAYWGFTPKVELFETPMPNAFAVQPNTVAVSSGLVQLIENRSELAFVLAHELGHFMLHPKMAHNAVWGASDTVSLEIQADRFAVSLLKNSHFDPQAGPALIRKLQNYGQEMRAPLGDLQPGLSKRHSALVSFIRTWN